MIQKLAFRTAARAENAKVQAKVKEVLENEKRTPRCVEAEDTKSDEALKVEENLKKPKEE